jgi:ABC-type multidrug transport system fused ATPase/permease subunit
MTNRISPVVSALRIGWVMLDPAEKTRLLALSIIQTVIRLIDIVALAAVVPIVMILVRQDTGHSSRVIDAVRAVLPNASPAEALQIGVVAVVVLLAISSAGSVAIQYASGLLALRSQTRTVGELLRAVIHGPLAWITSRNSAVLVRMLCNDTVTFARAFIEGIPSGIGGLVTIVLGIGIILFEAPLAGLGMFCLLGGIAYLIFRMTRARVNYFSGLQKDALNRLSVGLSQAADGIKDIKVSVREEYFVDACVRQAGQFGKAMAHNRFWAALGPSALIFLTQTALLFVALGLWWTNVNQQEVAARLTLILLISARMVPAFTRVGADFGRLASAEPFLRGLFDLRVELAALTRLNGGDARTEMVPDKWSAITFNNVSFEYSGSRIRALQNVSLEFKRGASYGIAGPSGSGKSTLVDLFLGLIVPTEGEVRIGSVALAKTNLRDWHRRIGFVPQVPFIADDTLRSNVAFGMPRDQVDDRFVTECLEAVRLGDFLADCRQGLDTPIGERGALVSGGQRQRIAIARALYQRPEVIVLDEATSALDTVNERAIQTVIKNLRGSITTITIAHRLTTIKTCDEILVLNAGRLVERGSFERLIAESGLFRDLAATAEPIPFVSAEPVAAK